MSSGFELTAVNNIIYNCIEKASIGIEPVNALILDNTFVPKEGLLWDYKAEINLEAAALGKTILQIVSFHNTCGGYLVYGVKETVKDKVFLPVYVDLSTFNSAQLRDKIKYYTGSSIDFTFGEVSCSISETEYKIGLICIPKRKKSINPVSFLKNGPDKSPGKPVFKRDETYFRHLDECLKANTPADWQTLFSARSFHPSYGVDVLLQEEYVNFLSHNLPDKNLICSRFVGREASLSCLWEWLSDEFEYTKILSGDGGKGKTSIAYEFCRAFIQTSPNGYERVVWLSVKETQFSGISNSYYDLQESDFIDSQSFLKCLADHCALETEEYDELSQKQIKRELKEALPHFPSLYIVDDIDSLEEDEQRKVVDICRQLGDNNIRFLITTRKKLAYSSDLCIDVPGLPIEDFHDYIKSIVEKYSLKDIRTRDVENLHRTCDGSPLLSASILRLYKQGISLPRAIAEWSGGAGEDARSAALKKEVLSLSPEAKRILLTIYYFKNCSFTELKQAAGVERLKLVDCLEELQSLFLVNEPRIIDSEERFSISNTTSLIISEIVAEMAFDHKRLNDAVKRLRAGPSIQKSGNRRKVGLAINQSLALLRDGRTGEAIATIDQELKLLSGNADLLLMKARCLMSEEFPDYSEVRALLKKSFDTGQRKELAFDFWYKAEEKMKSANGIIEVSQKALELDDTDKKLWYERLARGLILRSKVRSAESELKDLMEASQALTSSLKYIDKTAKEIRVEELNGLHDTIWRKTEVSPDYSWLSSFDMVLLMIKRGDVRTTMYINAHRCLMEAKAERKLSGKRREAYDICVERLFKQLESRPEKDKIDRPFLDIKKNLEEA